MEYQPTWPLVFAEEDLDRMHCKEMLEFVRHSNIAWANDGNGFFYSCYPGSAQNLAGGLTAKEIMHHQICYHRMGTLQSQDKVIFIMTEHPTWLLSAHLADNDDYLFIQARPGENSGNMVYCLQLDKFKDADGSLNMNRHQIKMRNSFIKLINQASSTFDFVSCSKKVAIYRTSHLAQNNRVIRINLERGNVSRWEELIPGHPSDTLEWVSRIKGDKLILCYIRNNSHVLEIRSCVDGKLFHTQALGDFGSIGTYSARPQYPDVFFTYSSPVEPSTIFHMNMDTMELTVHDKIDVPGYEPSNIETKQVNLARKWSPAGHF